MFITKSVHCKEMPRREAIELHVRECSPLPPYYYCDNTDSLSYTLLQLLEQLEGSREQCHHLESQLQKKEVAITAAQGKIELLTAEAQAKVEEF